MNPLIQLKEAAPLFLAAFACFGLFPTTRAVSPPPDGGYAGSTTAEGQNALFSLTTGTYNTAVGWFSLESLTTGSFNTGVEAGTLVLNTGSENTAVGTAALLSNTTGLSNAASGAFALVSNSTGGNNTAIGDRALEDNTIGGDNTAVGAEALQENTSGFGNVATGVFALYSNISGNENTANGYEALSLSTAGGNTAIGASALANDTIGASNTAIGDAAGINQTTGSNNVYIGAGINGVAGESDACRIGSIYGATITNGTEVFVNSDNRLGTITSSKRFKQNITPTSRASEVLYELQPVTFQYKKEIDPEGKWQFELVAEDVEKVNPGLVVHDKEGKPYSVRYDQVNAMLLNEFLKEHKRVEKQEATITQLKNDFQTVSTQQRKEIQLLSAQIKEQAAQIQKVSAQLEASKPAPQVVNNP
jgi:hypothetical protein